MLDYVKGAIFVILFLTIIGTLGKKVHKAGSFSENFIYGYILYTSVQFFGGFIVQQFNLPWIVFKTYMIILLLVMIVICFYKSKLHFQKDSLIIHFKRYWVVYFISVVFVSLSLLYLLYQWTGNNVDDGYYLMKIKMAPNVPNFNEYNFAAGLHTPASLIRNVNTFEIEGAFYSQLFGIEPAIFAKVFLALINYMIVLFTIHWFYTSIIKGCSKIKFSVVVMMPILFFGIYQEILIDYNILNMPGWQFNTAMWYGSSIVRTIGFILLITPILKAEVINKKDFLFFSLTCIALVSKAMQVLPVIFLVSIIYFIEILFKKVKNTKILITILCCFFIILIIIPVNQLAAANIDAIYYHMSNNFNMNLIKVSIFVLVISNLLGIKKVRKWNYWMLMLAIFMFVPRLNTAFAYISVYYFVAARTIILYIFTLVITAILELYLIFRKCIRHEKILKTAYVGFGIIMISIPLGYLQKSYGLTNTLQVIKSNPNFIPQSTINLGNQLELISEEKNMKLNVLMPAIDYIDNLPHALASLIRYDAPNITSVGAIPRFSETSIDSVFKTYDQKMQDIFERFNSGEDRDVQKMEKLLNDYPINCIIVYDNEARKILEELLNFQFVSIYKDDVMKHGYNILIKSN